MHTTITLLTDDTLRQAAIVGALLAVDYACVLAAILADLRSGTLRARRLKRPITSGGFRRTVNKAAHYFITLGAMTAADVLTLAPIIYLRASGSLTLPVLPPFTTLGALGLTLIELKSVVENSPQGSALTRMARRLRQALTAPRLAALLRALLK